MGAVCDIKIILLGESNSLSKTLITHSEKVIKIEENIVKLSIWDTAGREAYYKLVKSYYKVADGALLVYDVQNANTLSSLSKWLHDFKLVNENAEILIAGNKADDESKRSVYIAEVKNFVLNKKLDCIEVSAKIGININTLFHNLVRKILAAKGILPYSKDNCLIELEKHGTYFSCSSVSPELQETSDISSKIETLGESESPVTCLESAEQQPVNTMRYASSTRTRQSFIANEWQEDDDCSSGEYGFVFYSIENLETMADEDCQSIDSAESALEFFEAAR